MFTDVGQEVQHANELLVRLNQWKKLRQVILITIDTIIVKCCFFFNRLNDGKCQYHNKHGLKHKLYHQFIKNLHSV